MPWVPFAVLSAFTAALVAILGKLGLQNLDSTLATTIRAVIMTVILLLASLLLGKFNDFSMAGVSGKEWLFITGAGVAGALSWLFYFFALKLGPADGVVAIDRLSLVFVVVLASLFLNEAVSWKIALGAVLMVSGALLISLK